jgi:hypothetical protein
MGANKHTGPRRGSFAYRALKCLHAMGFAGAATWKDESAFKQSAREFDCEVVQQLLVWRLVEAKGDLYQVTAAGRSYLGFVDVASAESTSMTPGPYVPPRLPLQPQNRPALRVMRPGALDYRAIPSRMGDQIIPHGAKAVA